MRQNDHKVTNFSGPTQLYNLKIDVGEQDNLEAEHTQLVHQMMKDHHQWQNQLMDPIFMGLKQDSMDNTLNTDPFKRPDAVRVNR